MVGERVITPFFVPVPRGYTILWACMKYDHLFVEISSILA
jgi:hypothetical protein